MLPDGPTHGTDWGPLVDKTDWGPLVDKSPVFGSGGRCGEEESRAVSGEGQPFFGVEWKKGG